MATPVQANLSFIGASGKSYQINMYTADTAAYICKFSANSVAGAASLEWWRAPENVTLVDFSITTGTTQTTGVFTQDGAVRNGTVVGYVGHVSTASTRPPIRIQFAAGTLIGHNTI